jgi:hypothetical protein
MQEQTRTNIAPNQIIPPAHVPKGCRAHSAISSIDVAQIAHRHCNEIPADDGCMRGPAAYDSHGGQEQEDVVDLHRHRQSLRAEIRLCEGILWHLIIEEAEWVECNNDICVDTTEKTTSTTSLVTLE